MRILLIAFLSLALANAEEILVTESCGWLNRGLQVSAVVYNGADSIFVLGGIRSGYAEPSGGIFSRQVIRFNVTDESKAVVGEFPYLVAKGAAALEQNGDILHFGGVRQRELIRISGAEPSSDIFRIRRDNPQPQLLDQTLNVPRIGAAVVTIEDAIYLFGGDYCGDDPCAESTIEEFNTTTRNARIVGTFSAYKGTNSAVTDGTYAYIFGGYEASGQYAESRSIHRFDPKTLSMESLGELMPFGISNTGAAMVDHKAYVMTGSSVLYGGRPDAYVFDTLNQTVSDVGFGTSSYLSALSKPGLVHVPSRNTIYMFGVKSVTSGQFQTIYCLRLPTTTFECTGKPDGFYSHPTECSKFILCSNELKYEMSCPDGLHFNPETLICDHPEHANCNV